MRRRDFIFKFGATTLTIMGGYSLWEGLRFPGFGYDPKPLSTHYQNGIAELDYQNLFISQLDSLFDTTADFPVLRAFSPEPKITLYPKATMRKISIEINNISPLSRLLISTERYEETINKISRKVDIEVVDQKPIHITWELIEPLSFAVIGDTGGDRELAWCLKRAAQVKALFLMHLGDFNYSSGDYSRAIKQFQQASVPVFVSIGNHDFHTDGRLVEKFIHNIGPLNHEFVYQGVRFINLDTAVDTLPVSRGGRGRFLKSLANKDYKDTLVFTHKPLFDPQQDRDSAIKPSERDWLINELRKHDVSTWLAGHLHLLHDQDYAGFRHIIAGQGLGYQDIIHNKDVSRLVIGKLHKETKKIHFLFEALQMPIQSHCHPRIHKVLKNIDEHEVTMDEIAKRCNADTTSNVSSP